MKILILGAAGQIGRMLTDYLVEQTDHQLVLYARSANTRLKPKDTSRVTIISGNFQDHKTLLEAMDGVDVVYVNDMGNSKNTQTIVNAMKEAGLNRIIVASILGIYNEVPGAFGKWNISMVGANGIQKHSESAALVEVPELNYTILRLTWLYNLEGNKKYHLTYKGQPFEGAQVTRQAVAQLIVDIIEDKSGKYIKTSLGVGEPNTNWDKPSFY
ncbi:NAD(P)H-binding protein [Dyadobacter sp. NIV53]|uniref:NAD(P)H-binding protein n=1 Tax=Dyadobacter sp. NIV53 TaxID=2861765 RepID=UPI001C879FE8|nr:NAD(P)H-binding protein [Dyadobacter sp. NIV53]